MFSHQITNSIGDDIYNAFVYRNTEWMTHLHKSFEFLYVLEGGVTAQVEEQEYPLEAGDCLMVTPYQLHAYSTPEYSRCLVVVFAGSYVDSFQRMIANREAESPVFHLQEGLRLYLESVLLSEPEDNGDAVLAIPKPERLTLKACLYAVCAEFIAQTQLKERPRDNRLIFEILSYVENHFTQDISLYTLSDALGYDYRYLSRLFNQTLKISFKTLVNQYRCDRAKALIASTDETLAEVALTSGFQSIRSFNRVFKQTTGVMPSQIRRSERIEQSQG